MYFFVSTRISIWTCDSVVETFSGPKTMMYTLKVGFTIVNNLIQHRGLDCHLILQTVSEIPYLEATVTLRTVVTFVTWLISRTEFLV